AISTSINAIESAWRESDDGTGALEGALNGWDTRAMVRTEVKTRADETGALANQVTTVQATANGAQATAQESFTAVSDLEQGLSASWQIRTEVTTGGTTYMSGIAVGVEVNSGEVVRDVTVATDRFSVIDVVNEEVVAPFVVVNGQTIINDAVIGNASIGSAKLTDWLESDALGPGNVPVLRLNFRTGEIQVNSALPGGGRMTINNDGVNVYDANDTLRVELGYLS
ncbi:hypothetical protein C1141_20100, partial [Vibrio agarivorans]